MCNTTFTIGISTALPQENRASVGEDYPFSLLTELEAANAASASQRWGRVDSSARIVPAMFHIDRAGTVAWQDNAPIPVVDVPTLLKRLSL